MLIFAVGDLTYLACCWITVTGRRFGGLQPGSLSGTAGGNVGTNCGFRSS